MAEGPGGRRTLGRRALLQIGGAAAVGGAAIGLAELLDDGEAAQEANVFIGAAQTYDADLSDLILRGLDALGVGGHELRGARVLLKPNLVETAREAPHINTHPAVVVAVAEALRALGAQEVFVAEGQGHRRDGWLVLEESGMSTALADAGLRFVDLNHDEVVRVSNAGGTSSLGALWLPRTVLEADWVVTLPKVKTHHWAGVTCAMKNLFGVMPGVVYGWPKNPLHHAGIAQSILDINATVGPRLAIADGIVGMEGDGPIMGRAKPLGCLVMGTNPAAVDATCARLMGLDPTRVSYLRGASGWLGPILEEHVEQRGERIDALRTTFEVLDLPHLAGLAG